MPKSIPDVVRTGFGRVVAPLGMCVAALVVGMAQTPASAAYTPDATNQLQRWARSGTTVSVPPGTYVINETIRLSRGSVLKADGAVNIVAGANPRGELDANGLHISIEGSGAGVEGITILQPRKPLAYTSDEPSTIRVFREGTSISGARVMNCRLLGPGLNEIRVKGTLTSDTTVRGNYLEKAAGISYSYMGAKGTRAIRNTVLDSSGNGMSSAAVDGSESSGSIVDSNSIVRPRRMGIEDWGETSGAIIRNNRVESSFGIGISAVGWRSQVKYNTVSDARDAGIEVAARETRVYRNTVSSSGYRPISGIIADGGSQRVPGHIQIVENKVVGTRISIQSHGNVGILQVRGNKVLDWWRSGIVLEASPHARFTVQANQIATRGVNRAEDVIRHCLLVDADQALIDRNSCAFETPSSDLGWDYFLKMGNVSGVVVTGNTFDASRSRASRPAVVGSNGAHPVSTTISGNSALGDAVLYESDFDGLELEDNPGLRII